MEITCHFDATGSLIATIDGQEWAGIAFERSPDGAITITSDTEIGGKVATWLAEGGTVTPYTPPPPPSLDEVKAQARAAVITFADSLTARITSQYPAAEVASWPTRAAEAAAVKAGAVEAETPLITALAAASGQTRAAIADAITAKALAYTSIVVAVSVLREQTGAAIEAAKTPAAVTKALEMAKAAALAQASKLGLA